MQRTFLILFAACSAMIFSYDHSTATTTDPGMLIKRVQEKMKSSKSLSYDIKYRFKCFDCDDTDFFDAHVDILREPTDTLAGCYLLVQQHIGGYLKLYDMKNVYFLNPKDTSIEVIDAHKYNWKYVTRGNVADGVISSTFIHPARLEYDFDPSEIQYVKDSIGTDNHPLNIFISQKHDDGGFEGYPDYLVIDPILDFCIYSRDLTKWQGNFQYREVKYSNVEFDKVDSNYFTHYKMPEGYRRWNYEPKKKTEEKLLDNGTVAPDFIAKQYPDTTLTTKLSDYRGKIVVMDFWYMSCYPCVQALPALEELNKKYKNKGVIVLGVNSTDLRVKHVHKLPDFFQHNPITYSTILPDRSVDEMYHVTGYPSMYIIDQNGKIAYSQMGYGPTVESLLAIKLDDMLK